MIITTVAIIIFATLERLLDNRALRLASIALAAAGGTLAAAGYEPGLLVCLLGIVAIFAGLLEDILASRTPKRLEPERHEAEDS